MKRKITLISGWGAGPGAFGKITDRLSDNFDFGYVPWEKCVADPGYAAGAIKSSGERTIVMGWSLGGLIGLQTAIEAPDMVTGLVLVSSTARMTACDGYEGAPPVEIRAMSARLGKNREAVLESFARKAFGDDAAAGEKYLKEARSFGAGELAAGLEYLKNTDIRLELGSIKAPALIFHGTLDPIIPAGQAVFLNRNIGSSELELIDARHGLLYDMPDTAVEKIRSHKWM